MSANWLWDRKISDFKAKKILKEPGSKNFTALAALLLSRNNDPQEVFKGYIDPLVFCIQWASIRRRMRQDKWNQPRIVFWQAVYEKLADKYHKKGIVFRKEIISAKDPLCQETGKRVSAIRHLQGLSQKELAKKIGISQQLISRVEKGRENVSLSTLTNIARALNMRVCVDFIKM